MGATEGHHQREERRSFRVVATQVTETWLVQEGRGGYLGARGGGRLLLAAYAVVVSVLSRRGTCALNRHLSVAALYASAAYLRSHRIPLPIHS